MVLIVGIYFLRLIYGISLKYLERLNAVVLICSYIGRMFFVFCFFQIPTILEYQRNTAE